MVQRAQLANIGRPSGATTLRDGNGITTRYYPHKAGDRAKLTTAYRKRARWALKLGLSATRALTFVPEADRDATARLMAEEATAARPGG